MECMYLQVMMEAHIRLSSPPLPGIPNFLCLIRLVPTGIIRTSMKKQMSMCQRGLQDLLLFGMRKRPCWNYPGHMELMTFP